jgi:OPA family glycerol-3-phosphate transporter-like MFS transporter
MAMDPGTAANRDAPPCHSSVFRARRFLNWFPLGLSYAFLYMGRYNLTVAKNALGVLMTNEDFGIIFGVGTVVYGLAFLVNGPLTDKVGGKRALLAAALGCALMNFAMGLYLAQVLEAGTINNANLRFSFCVLYAANMYFQSFGAVAVVKVNAHWFHVRERGGFGGIFGTMIASGIFMAFTVNSWILQFAQSRAEAGGGVFQTRWVFFVPAILLLLMFVIEAAVLRDRPSDAGYADFDTGDEGSEDDVRLSAVMMRVITHPVVLTVALIEFCTGLIRQGVMQWYQIYTKSVLSLPSSHPLRDGSWGHWSSVVPFFALALLLLLFGWRSGGSRRGWLFSAGGLVFLAPFLQAGWGGILFVAGVIGSNAAGHLSDLLFQSRRAPVAGVLYGVLAVCTLGMVFARGETTNVVAESSEPLLRPGDRIVSIAGQGGFRDWTAASEAFASVPAKCLGGARWDAVKHICSSKPERVDESLRPSNGTIEVTVQRAGQLVSMPVRDPSPVMRAGDRRLLRATPEPTRSPYLLGLLVFVISVCVIGSHGVLSGTASADFGGRRGAATAVGMIDGFVYLGTAFQSVALGYLTERSWSYWPWFLLPFAIIGFSLCLRIWSARPRQQSAAAAEMGPVAPAGLPPEAGTST